MSGINEYMTMIEEETKAADKTKEINKETPKKKGRKKHNISFKYLISGNVHYSNDNKILQALEILTIYQLLSRHLECSRF